MRVQCLILLHFFEDVILQALKETAAQFKRQSQSLRQVRNYSYRDYHSGMNSLSLHYSYFVYSPFSSTRCMMKTFLNFTRLITKYELSRLSEWLESVVFINQAWKYQNQFLLYWFDKNLAPKHRPFFIVTFTTPGQFLCMHEGGKEWIFYIVIFIVISFYLLIYFFVF